MALCTPTLPVSPLHRSLVSISPSGFFLSCARFLGLRTWGRSINVLRSPAGSRVSSKRWNSGIIYFSLSDDLDSGNGTSVDGYVKKRNIVEHILLLRAKKNLSDAEEKDMLDYLYTSQYQMSGIIAMSLGRIECPNLDNFTHAVYMRFQRKEDLAKFYSNSYYSRILKEHVTPYCYGSVSVDYESEVEDDIIPIFRRGEEFNYGVECMLLISISKTAPGHAVEDALASLWNLTMDFGSNIVQATQVEAFKIFTESPIYKDMWKLKFHAITRKALLLHFLVDPVGTELMCIEHREKATYRSIGQVEGKAKHAIKDVRNKDFTIYVERMAAR
ncbi:Stress responsive A/B Barrel Domain [Musa troglodytarum]|uniref:Stress responsive A/B Barrel Domain n=1 Tax=Musa troglodytarum TaxID=320322 RepID=A0A9E7G3H4_9LILI|nr:Stress responsive A/B Barrel Domain [Musa troglodytarum]